MARLARHAGKGQSIGAYAYCTTQTQAKEKQVERDKVGPPTHTRNGKTNKKKTNNYTHSLNGKLGKTSPLGE